MSIAQRAVGNRADCHEAVSTDPEGPPLDELISERRERVRRLLPPRTAAAPRIVLVESSVRYAAGLLAMRGVTKPPDSVPGTKHFAPGSMGPRMEIPVLVLSANLLQAPFFIGGLWRRAGDIGPVTLLVQGVR